MLNPTFSQITSILGLIACCIAAIAFGASFFCELPRQLRLFGRCLLIIAVGMGVSTADLLLKRQYDLAAMAVVVAVGCLVIYVIIRRKHARCSVADQPPRQKPPKSDMF